MSNLLASTSAEAISAAQLAEFNATARATGRSLWDVLEEGLPATPAECAARLGAALRLPVADMAALHRLEPDFSALSYAEAARRKCLVAQDAEAGTVCILSDPFDLPLQTWLETRLAPALNAAPAWRLAHPADLAAYFTVFEEKLRAMDGLLPAIDEGTASIEAAAEDLSLASIAQDASPIVRLINSTIFDAMKIGASDIHLESNGQGLVVKYRIDGVLTQVAEVTGRETAEQAVRASR